MHPYAMEGRDWTGEDDHCVLTVKMLRNDVRLLSEVSSMWKAPIS